ncbi:TetR/AcrR family transcriptional regulator [Bogoriella caseilytica]|uniref:TetR family transcriptional regulator n=1 Tax=Bogoriella caseilytica TaxID=56055 RepID=A0A3N2BCA5_9MICO|nr:TetR/AcrR family transcriptional regulator [Bogoriella caseilytica]ROR72903.1 TetR family transcriptional regulator [Bogoriella caseilytica]
MTDATETGLPRVVAIAWGMHEAPQRGPSRALSHERIVEAAIEVADTEGLAAVTMQAVAKALGFTTMSLYRYVSSKDELLRLMQDAALSVPEKLKLPADWSEALRVWALMVREAYRAHPWALQIPRGPVSILMPNSVRAADLGLAAMKELPLDDDVKIATILVISQHVSSSVELEQDLADEGVVTIPAEGAQALAEVITAERFPHLVPVIESGNYIAADTPVVETDNGVDAEFDLGLDLIISGLDAKVRSGTAG